MTTSPADTEPLHQLLAQARSERKLSIAALAAQTGLSPNAVRWIERGITKPKPESLRALGAALELPYELLLQRAGYLEQQATSSGDQEVLELFRQLTADRQVLALQLLRALGEAPPVTALPPTGTPGAAATK